jgi:hypothetical protein
MTHESSSPILEQAVGMSLANAARSKTEEFSVYTEQNAQFRNVSSILTETRHLATQ